MSGKKLSLTDAMRGVIGEASTGNMGVSESDTGREKIEYLPRTALVADQSNFYAMSGIDELAANIECIGLQQPLRVRPVGGHPDLYRIVSGHRRRAALDKLALAGSRAFEEVPCIVERDEASPALRELRLIYANADTRKLSDGELAQQVERVTELLYKLQEEGYEFPGRMRDHVAESCRISRTKAATIAAARKNLIPELRQLWERGIINTSQATALYKASPDVQRQLIEWQGSSVLAKQTAEDLERMAVQVARENERKAARKNAPKGESESTETDILDEYLDQRKKEEADVLYFCRTVLLKSLSPYLLFAETRRDGIETLKNRCKAMGSWGGDVDWDGSPKGIKIYQKSKKDGAIERTWTELWDALAVAALMEAGKTYGKSN